MRISNQRRDHANRKRAERVASMGLEEAVAFMKQARCNALYVAKTRTPDKLLDVQALWAKEWEEFEAWQRTQGPPASSASAQVQ